MDESSELEVKTSNDQGVSSSAQSENTRMDEELDGLPVFGTDEDDWEMDSTFSQRVFSQLDRNSDDDDNDNENDADKNDSQDGAPTTATNAEENSSSTIGSSEMDEGRTKVCEENSVTPSSDAIIDIQETQSLVEKTPQRDANKDPPGQHKETHFSPVIQIKDEPIDEDYDKALVPQSDTSNVKQEMEINENEASSPSDELRISSVFSVSGNNSDAVSASVATVQQSSFPVLSTSLRGTLVLPAQTQPQFQLRIHPRAQIQTQIRTQSAILSHAPVQPPAPPAHAPPPTVRICCSGCSKVLQKGQTAFQRKGSNQLFCSTVCLTSFSLPSVQFTPIIAPKKTCNLCLKVIVNLKDLITIPVGSMNTLKEFCSLACLNIYKDRYENAPPDLFTQCSVCKLIKEIQHEVTHLGVVHKLCSDECFARFRSSRNLYMSYCENCGNCNASGNYHLVQIEDGIKKFCTTDCITTFKQKSGKRLSCPYCQEFKNIDQMIDGTNIQGVTEFFCSQRCVALSQASPSLTGTSFPCTSCKKLAVPQYHLAIADGSIRNFCSLDCVGRFQGKMNASVPPNQINGNSYEPQNAASEQPTEQHAPTQTSSSNVSGQSQNSVSAPGLVNSQETKQQKPTKRLPSAYAKELECMQCHVLFQDKPQIFQYKGQSGAFCTRACCEAYKREYNVKAVCEYCKLDKVVKDIITYEKQLRYFCCEGCKLLFKHDLTKRQGVQFRFCAYCQNMTHKTVQNFFGGKLEEFCTEDCMSQYTVLFYEMAKCYNCKHQGPLKESLVLYGSKKHFCNMNCLRNFCSRTLMYRQSRNSTLPNTTTVQAPLPITATVQAPLSITTTVQAPLPITTTVQAPLPITTTVQAPLPITTTVQAPLSISKDMPVIGGVVSLASTLPGNTAVTGALPTSNANSKNIGEASTQTDAAVPDTPHRRTLKNKALMCRPITEEQGVQCQRDPPTAPLLSETVIDENGEKVRLVPFPVPIPMPVYIPVPMHLYTQYTPFPLGLPLPVPVPVVIPGSQDADEPKERKSSLPAQSSVEDDDGDKGKDKPMSHDQGSTYSGDLESEARSTPFSWADNEEPGVSGKPLVPSAELEDPEVAATSASPEHPDLEDDFPRSLTDPGSAKENRLVLTLKRHRKGRDGYPAKKRGRKRSGTDTSGGVWLSTSSSKLNQVYGVAAWTSWVKTNKGQTPEEEEQQSPSAMVMKEDVLQCSSAELGDGLCRFIKEVRRPNGEVYEPDSVYYLCLGIQQRLLENGRLENIFTDSLYSEFIHEITTLLKDWSNTLPPEEFINSRVEEEYLWECKQLGALSPIVLLNTLLFFGAKMLHLKTVEQHRCLTFSNVTQCSKTTKTGVSSYLKFKLPKKEKATDKRAAVKRKREEEAVDEQFMEMPENSENPLRCPVRLYQFYLSKCSDSVKQRPDLFYLQPDSACHPSSPVWYSAQPLDTSMMESMLTRIVVVRDIHLDSTQQKYPDSSDEESSQ